MRHPVDILVHIQPNVRHDAREEDVLTRAERLDADRLPFEVAHGADALRPEQHEAASVDARQQDDRVASVYLDDTGRHEVEAEVGVPSREGLGRRDSRGGLKVLHVGEPFAVQEILRYILGSDADAGNLDQLDPRGFRRWLGGRAVGSGTHESRRPRQRQPAHELASAPRLAPVTHGDLLGHKGAGRAEYGPRAYPASTGSARTRWRRRVLWLFTARPLAVRITAGISRGRRPSAGCRGSARWLTAFVVAGRSPRECRSRTRR